MSWQHWIITGVIVLGCVLVSGAVDKPRKVITSAAAAGTVFSVAVELGLLFWGAHPMTWPLWVVAAWLIYSAISVVLKVGRYQKPLEPWRAALGISYGVIAITLLAVGN